jgi:hypothetical protein
LSSFSANWRRLRALSFITPRPTSVAGKLFAPTDEVADYLHVIDTYGTLLLLAGFVIWITLGIIFLILKRFRNEGDDDEREEDDE